MVPEEIQRLEKIMSNRFHSKFHRQNHHTYVNNFNADAGHDPIASRQQPFQGDFVLSGALSSYAPTSAVAGFFYSNNTALCAWAGRQAIYAFSKGNTTNTGIYVYSTGVALTAQADVLAGNFYSDQFGIAVFGGAKAIRAHSNNIGLDSYGTNYGGIFNSLARGLSSHGDIYGIETTSGQFGINARGASGYGGAFFSNTRGVSAWGGTTGLDVASNNIAINATAPNKGLVVTSAGRALETGGTGVNYLNNKTFVMKLPDPTSIYNFEVGGAGAYFDGNSYIRGNLTVIGDLSAAGRWSYLDTKVILSSSMQVLNQGTDAAVTINQTGPYPILQCFDTDISTTIPSFIVDGATKGWVALGATKPQAPLYIVKNATEASNQPQIVITDDTQIPQRIAIGLEPSIDGNPFIGTQSNHHLLFETASSTQMFLTSSGRVGIGHSSYKDTMSSTRLDVNGAITLRGETLNLTHTQTQNTSGVYLFLPSIGTVEGFTDYALLRQIGGPGLNTGTPFGLYHLTLDLHNDGILEPGQGWLYNQEFSIRNVGSDGAGNDVIQSRIKIDGRGNVGINLAEGVEMSDYNYKLNVNGGISANGGLLLSAPSTFSGNLTLNSGDLKITNPTYDSQNAVTFNQADTRYGVLSAKYKNGNSGSSVNSTTVYFDPLHNIFLQTGIYIFECYSIVNTSNTFGIKTQFRVDSGTMAANLIETFGRPEGTPLLPLSAIEHTTFPTTNDRILISVAASDYMFQYKGIVQVTSPGVLSFVMANGSAGTQTLTLKEYSYIRAEKIG